MTLISSFALHALGGVCALVILGVALLMWGGRPVSRSLILLAAGILILIVANAALWSGLSEHSYQVESWIRGWIGPRDESTSITVGFMRDAQGLAVSWATAVIASVFLVLESVLGAGADSKAGGRFPAAMAFACAGVALSWWSATPWLSVCGIVLTILGGFIALCEGWMHPAEASLAARYASERAWGLVASVAGLCVLASGQSPLGFAPIVIEPSFSATLGATLLFLGLYIQLHPFPFLGWQLTQSSLRLWRRATTTQLFLGWAAVSTLIRFDDAFRKLGISPAVGSFALLSTFLTSFAGLFVGDWRISFGLWIASGFSWSVAALAYSGAASSWAIVIGLGLAGAALAAFGSLSESIRAEGKKSPKPIDPKARAVQIGVFASIAAGTGGIGFFTFSGFAQLSHAWMSEPVLAVAGFSCFALYVFQAWKTGFQSIFRLSSGSRLPWAAVLSPYFLLVSGLGLVWTGSLVEGIHSGAEDRWFRSIWSLSFPALSNNSPEETSLVLGWSALLGVWTVSTLLGIFLAVTRPQYWEALPHRWPRMSRWVVGGYGVDYTVSRLKVGLRVTGDASVRLLDVAVWKMGIPRLLTALIQRTTRYANLMDAALANTLNQSMGRGVDYASRGLQLIQGGDVQWYLFYALGAGLALMAYFVKN